MAYNNTGKFNSTIIGIGLAGVILIGVLVFMFFLNASTTKEADVVITSDAFKVEGMYGESVSFTDVTSIELKDTMPAVGRKNNGSGIGETKKGYFDVVGMGECLLFIHADKGPYIYINTTDKQIIMNYKDGEKTQKVYNDMISNWKK